MTELPLRHRRIHRLLAPVAIASVVALLTVACGASATRTQNTGDQAIHQQRGEGAGVEDEPAFGRPDGEALATKAAGISADARLPRTIADPNGFVLNAWADGLSPGSMVDVFVEDLAIEAPDGWTQADLDGDGQAEWIGIVRGPECSSDPRLWVIGLDQRIEELSEVCQPLGDCGQTCRVTGVRDLTGDGLVDVVIESVVQGAHTDTMLYRVVTGHGGGGLVNRVSQPPDSEALARDAVEMTYATATLADETGDGVADLRVEGGLVGSAGAGEFQRTRREVWSFDGDVIVRVDTSYASSDIRLFWLYEANDAWAADELERARRLYTAVVEDAALRDVKVQGSVETRDAVRQWAAFRMLLINLYTNAPEDDVAVWTRFFEANYPETPWAQAARMLFDTWNGDLASSCEAVTAELTAGKYSWAPLSDMGYANPVLDGSNLCAR